jgi:ribonuclease HI
MNSALPRFTLISESTGDTQGRWSFVLRDELGRETISAADCEPNARRERLELLAIVRGLEALEQPSRVTVQTNSQYVRRGIAYGLEEWRSNGWTWEHFGQMVLVKNHDLWQRLDRALAIHQVECRQWRFDGAHYGGAAEPGQANAAPAQRRPSARPAKSGLQRLCGLLRGSGQPQAAAS